MSYNRVWATSPKEEEVRGAVLCPGHSSALMTSLPPGISSGNTDPVTIIALTDGILLIQSYEESKKEVSPVCHCY